jgi:hypothetical protein
MMMVARLPSKFRLSPRRRGSRRFMRELE